ncbi:Uncharacterised protein g5119 [Pycnogonum litorale]
MVIRLIIRYLSNNEHVINKIASSYPIKRAAQFTAYMIHKGQEIGHENVGKIQKENLRNVKGAMNESTSKLRSFKNRFSQELKDGMKNLNEELKKKS